MKVPRKTKLTYVLPVLALVVLAGVGIDSGEPVLPWSLAVCSLGFAMFMMHENETLHDTLGELLMRQVELLKVELALMQLFEKSDFTREDVQRELDEIPGPEVEASERFDK